MTEQGLSLGVSDYHNSQVCVWNTLQPFYPKKKNKHTSTLANYWDSFSGDIAKTEIELGRVGLTLKIAVVIQKPL